MQGDQDKQLHVLPLYRPLNPDGLEMKVGGNEGSDMGALPHGSLLLEVARQEHHATTALCEITRKISGQLKVM